jgi:hypothetical protein
MRLKRWKCRNSTISTALQLIPVLSDVLFCLTWVVLMCEMLQVKPRYSLPRFFRSCLSCRRPLVVWLLDSSVRTVSSCFLLILGLRLFLCFSSPFLSPLSDFKEWCTVQPTVLILESRWNWGILLLHTLLETHERFLPAIMKDAKLICTAQDAWWSYTAHLRRNKRGKGDSYCSKP